MLKKSVVIAISVILFIFGILVSILGLAYREVSGGFSALIVGICLLLGSGFMWLLYLVSSPDVQVKLRRRELVSSQSIKFSEESSDLPMKDKHESVFCSKCGLVLESSDQKCKNCGEAVS